MRLEVSCRPVLIKAVTRAKFGAGEIISQDAPELRWMERHEMILPSPPAIPVVSTLLASVAYDRVGSILELEFRDGAIYHYFVVPETIYQALLIAESKGAYFNHRIRNHFSHRRIRPPK